MLKNLSKTKKTILVYLAITLTLVLLTLIGLFFNEWVISVGMVICSLVGLINLTLLLKSESSVTEDGIKSSFIIYSLLRFLLMAGGLVACGFLVHFTMVEPVNKLRYLYIAISALPYFATTISLSLIKE